MSPIESNLEGSFTLESGGNVVEDDDPFHILCLGNWSGNGENETALDKRRPMMIDRDNFDDSIRKIRPKLSLDFDGENALSLTFTELDDFHPDNIFRQISLFENLRDLRKKLKNTDTFDDAAREVRSWFAVKEEVHPTEKQSNITIDADDLLDEILSGKSFDASAVSRKPASSTELSQFISDIVQPHIIKTDLAEQANLLMAVDEVISDLMCKVLHHKDFLALEAAWRGLYFLVRKTDTDTDLKIYLLDISKDELADNLKSVSDLSDSIYYQWTAGEILETSIGEPWAVVCGNYGFGPNVDDIATLMRLSQIGAASNTSFISHIRPEVLGIKSLAENPSSKDWNISEDSTEWKLWNALRSNQESEYLGLAMPRFLARLPYGQDTDPAEVFSFEEFNTTGEHNNYVWSNPSFLCAYLLAKSFRKNGWEMAENIAREIDGLPMHIYKEDGETKTKPCAEIPMTEAGVQKMSDAGIMPLVSFRDSDRVRVASFQSIALSEERIRGRWY
ncbi:MAG TPA: type VI secretion system contractile sheath large subunit [Pyrinomonadaceae bacterium]|nr:type VI secretion system contractile sheath large subunit [Pyrinomonadaceae bacterium]